VSTAGIDARTGREWKAAEAVQQAEARQKHMARDCGTGQGWTQKFNTNLLQHCQ